MDEQQIKEMMMDEVKEIGEKYGKDSSDKLDEWIDDAKRFSRYSMLCAVSMLGFVGLSIVAILKHDSVGQLAFTLFMWVSFIVSNYFSTRSRVASAKALGFIDAIRMSNEYAQHLVDLKDKHLKKKDEKKEQKN